MSKKPTDPLARKRDHLAATLTAVETIRTTSPVLPENIDVRSTSVDLYFHQAPEHVVAFGAAFGLDVTLAQRSGGRSGLRMEADGRIDDVPVRAWTLGAAEDGDRFQAALGAPVGVPSAWRAAGAA